MVVQGAKSAFCHVSSLCVCNTTPTLSRRECTLVQASMDTAARVSHCCYPHSGIPLRSGRSRA